MIRCDVRVCNRLGLHARAAARFVHLAKRFESEIFVVNGASRANGKSILGLLTLAASCGTLLQLTTEGGDERVAADALTELIRGGFEEPQ